MSELRILLLTNMIAPYRIPLFNAIAHQNRQFRVVSLRKREDYRTWLVYANEIAFAYEVLHDDTSQGMWPKLVYQIAPRLVRVISRFRPDVLIIGGWGYVENWIALCYGKSRRIPVVLWGGVTANSAIATSTASNALRRLFVKACSAVVAYSTCAAEEFRKLGAPSDRIAIGRNVGDVEFFYERIRSFRKTDDYSQEYGRWPRPLFLYVGQLIGRKGIGNLLEALSVLPLPTRWGLIIVGSGPEKGALVQFCSERHLDNVYFTGFRQRNDLVRYFALADAFILPSLRETGAIVLSEALASGLFILPSKYDGVAPDLIIHGRNGYFIDPNHTEGLSNQIKITLQRYRTDPWDRDNIADEFMRTKPLTSYATALLNGVHSACRVTEKR
jgi:glycosyltransferase involved in cell wall biosynthesis